MLVKKLMIVKLDYRTYKTCLLLLFVHATTTVQECDATKPNSNQQFGSKTP